jgi:hypothetical protein
LAGKRYGVLQVIKNLGKDQSTAEDIFECRCACGRLHQLSMAEMADQSGAGEGFTCSGCCPAVTRREQNARQEYRADVAAEQQRTAVAAAEAAKLRAIQREAERQARLVLEFGQEYVDQQNARKGRR